MTLNVLGSSASSPDAGDACAGYLVQQGAVRILLDCGSGVLGNLRLVTEVESLSAIVISHFHPDHFLDLIPMRYGLKYGLTQPVRPRLFVPPGGIAFLEGVGQAIRRSPDFFTDAFQVTEYDPQSPIHIDDLTLTFQRTTHDEPTWACAVQGAARLVYTADTRESVELERFAAGADLLLCEATYPAAAGALTGGSANHLTSHQAGALARSAGARTLMLTHFWPGLDLAVFGEEAARAYGAPVILAHPGLVQPIVAAAESIHELSVHTLQEV
jgi:ribonuclease BN (tRNA processing enzyme)